jgi:hypothetical protein
MAEKLSRIIREKEASKSEITKNVILEIKKLLLDASKTNKRPELTFELESDLGISIPFERKLTFEQTETQSYIGKPTLADDNFTNANHLSKLFSQSNIDKTILRKRISDILRNKSQTTLFEVIESNGGITKGLPEVFSYIGIIKEFKYTMSPEKTQRVIFDDEQNKSIQIPVIILSK